MDVVPTRSDLEAYTFNVELDGVTFGVEVAWNARDGAWYLSVWDANFSVALLASRKLVADVQLLGRMRDPHLPLGELTVLDTTGGKADPGRYDLGSRHILLYEAFEDLPSAFRLG